MVANRAELNRPLIATWNVFSLSPNLFLLKIEARCFPAHPNACYSPSSRDHLFIRLPLQKSSTALAFQVRFPEFNKRCLFDLFFPDRCPSRYDKHDKCLTTFPEEATRSGFVIRFQFRLESDWKPLKSPSRAEVTLVRISRSN